MMVISQEYQGSPSASAPAPPDWSLDVSTIVTVTATSHVCATPSRVLILSIQWSRPRSCVHTESARGEEKSVIWQLPAPVVGNGTLSPCKTHMLEGLFPNKRVWLLGSQKYGTGPPEVIPLKLCLSELSCPAHLACGKHLRKLRSTQLAVQKMAHKLELCWVQSLETQSEFADLKQNIILRVRGGMCFLEPRGW